MLGAKQVGFFNLMHYPCPLHGGRDGELVLKPEYRVEEPFIVKEGRLFVK